MQFWFCSVLIWLHQERESRTSFKQQVDWCPLSMHTSNSLCLLWLSVCYTGWYVLVLQSRAHFRCFDTHWAADYNRRSTRKRRRLSAKAKSQTKSCTCLQAYDWTVTRPENPRYFAVHLCYVHTLLLGKQAFDCEHYHSSSHHNCNFRGVNHKGAKKRTFSRSTTTY